MVYTSTHSTNLKLTDTLQFNGFEQPLETILILNVVMGGTFGGAIDPAFSESSMEVDYIRVYQ